MKTLRLLFGLFVIGAAVVASWKVIPAYVNNYQFQESIDDSARMGVVNSQKSEDDIRNGIYEQAQSLKLPLKPEDITVQRDNNGVFISADYVVHVDLPGYPFDLSFHPSSNRQGFNFK
jgi:Domain of unknown function (DUF4845)